jgi:hypothetical protein
MDGEAAFERFGAAAGLLGAALADVPLADAMRDWRTDPRWVRPGDPPVEVLCGELRSAGMSAGQAEVLDAAARRTGRWWPSAGGLPAQVIHGDLAPSGSPASGCINVRSSWRMAAAAWRRVLVPVCCLRPGVLDCSVLACPLIKVRRPAPGLLQYAAASPGLTPGRHNSRHG